MFVAVEKSVATRNFTERQKSNRREKKKEKEHLSISYRTKLRSFTLAAGMKSVLDVVGGKIADTNIVLRFILYTVYV